MNEAVNIKPTNGRKVSEFLSSVLNSHNKDTITIGEFKDAIASRSYGVLMMMLAMPLIIPIPTPGLSAIICLPLMLITAQLMWGKKTPWLPGFVTRKEFKTDDMKKAIKYVDPYLKRLEKVLRPRYDFLLSYSAERVIAIICFTLSLVIMLPIPFGNAIPAFIIFLFSLAILTKDGVLVIAATVFASLGTALISKFVGAMISSMFS